MIRIVFRRKNGAIDTRTVSDTECPFVASQIVFEGNIVLRLEWFS